MDAHPATAGDRAETLASSGEARAEKVEEAYSLVRYSLNVCLKPTQ